MIGTQRCEYVPEEEPIVPIDTISLGTEDTILSGTKWKLVGFVDTATGKMKAAKPKESKCYTLMFNKNNILSGISSANTISGHYTIEQESSKIQIQLQPTTTANEVCDGTLYLQTINTVQSFSVKEKEALMLYYNDKKNYLLYKEDTISVDNPLPDLPWMKAYINAKIKDAEAMGLCSYISIYQCTYNNNREIGFLIECPDERMTTLYNREGIALCMIGGDAGDACKEYNIDYTNQILIWEY
jgi:hypothetical protein